jgi:hypothetical protein
MLCSASAESSSSNAWILPDMVRTLARELRSYEDALDSAPVPDPALAAGRDAERTAACEDSRRTYEICGDTRFQP